MDSWKNKKAYYIVKAVISIIIEITAFFGCAGKIVGSAGKSGIAPLK